MEELVTSIGTGTHTAVFGLQRMGKTSLIEQGLKFELERRPSFRNALLVAAFVHHIGSLLKDPSLKRQLTFIVLVRPFIAEYDERQGLQLLKLMKPITLRHLDEDAAKELITQPLEPYVSYEHGAVDCLYRLTAGHPYRLQFMLKLIVDRLKREARPLITIADIKWLQKRMISDGPAYDAQFAVLVSDYSVDETTHPKEAELGKGLLALVSKLGQHQGGWAAGSEIFEALGRHRIPEEKTASLLSQLTRTCILEEDNVGDELRYRLSIPLVQERFVRQNLYLKYFRRH